MKYLLKWMNNVEKEQNEAFRPMYNYTYYRQKAHEFAISAIMQGTGHGLGPVGDTGILDPVSYTHLTLPTR